MTTCDLERLIPTGSQSLDPEDILRWPLRGVRRRYYPWSWHSFARFEMLNESFPSPYRLYQVQMPGGGKHLGQHASLVFQFLVAQQECAHLRPLFEDGMHVRMVWQLPSQAYGSLLTMSPNSERVVKPADST